MNPSATRWTESFGRFHCNGLQSRPMDSENIPLLSKMQCRRWNEPYGGNRPKQEEGGEETALSLLDRRRDRC